MDMEVFLQKEGFFPGVHKIGAAISGPRVTRGLKGPFRTKNTTAIAKIVNCYAVVFLLRPPNLVRRGPFLVMKMSVIPRKLVSAQGAPR